MSLHKAKTLNGEWVIGWLDFSAKDNPIIWFTDKSEPNKEYDHVSIKPSTLCQQVRGTEFFEGDEVINERGVTGVIYFDEDNLCYNVKIAINGLRKHLFSDSWKPTGKNHYDYWLVAEQYFKDNFEPL